MVHRDISALVGEHLNLPHHAFLFTVLCLSSAESLRTTLASSLREELAWKICCSETPPCPRGAPSAGHNVPVWAALGREELKDSSGFLLFPGREKESV